MTSGTWAEARPRIAAALAHSNGPETIEDVQRDLVRGEAQLWHGPHASAVTQIDGDDLHVWLLGGDMRGVPGIVASAAAWAAHCGLRRITIDRARQGWARVLAPLGFAPASDVQLARQL